MTVYYVTVNQPGYSPEFDPIGCETLDDARQYLLNELESTWGEGGDDDDSAAYDAACGAARTAMPGDSVMFGAIAHSITESAEAF